LDKNDLDRSALSVRNISVSFAGVSALDDVSLEFRPGEIHALVGENGAGKSTLGKVISGAETRDDGSIYIDGRPERLRSPHDALQRGVSRVAQEISLAGHLSVLENIYLGIDPHFWTSRKRILARFRSLVEWSGIQVEPDIAVEHLSLAEQQKVEILRALARESNLIIFDEPTAALGLEETQLLLKTMKSLKERGCATVFVSHFLEEVLEASDRISVLRDGRLVGTYDANGTTREFLIERMIGQSTGLDFPPKTVMGEERHPEVLSATHLTAHNVDDVSLSVRAGEIVALTGLVGSGRSEVLEAVFTGAFDSGTVTVDAKRNRSIAQSIRSGVSLIPESRKDQGLLLTRSIRENASLAHKGSTARLGWISRRRETRKIKSLIEGLRIRCSSIEANVETLSGGNQQKVMFAKWLYRTPRLLLIDEPTRGVDVGAKAAIYNIIHSLAAEGMAVLMVTSEFEEVEGLAHRAYVMSRGKVVAELGPAEMSVEKLLALSFLGDPASRNKRSREQ